MRRPAKKALLAEINVVPYIDVMLVLLVIFMVTVPIIQQGVEIELPKANAEQLPPEDEQPLIMTVRRDGKLFLNKGSNIDQPIPRAQLAEKLTRLLKAEEGRIYVRGDHNVRYGLVVEVMAALQAAGAGQIGLITENPVQ